MISKHVQKNIATSFTALAFFVVGVSGVLMYFHLFHNYIGELHEIIGLFFVGVVLFHVFYNFKSMKSHFKTKAFWIGATLLTVISLAFIFNADEGENPKKVIITSLLKAPISSATQILGRDMTQVESQLKTQNMKIEPNDSIESIAKRYKVSPFHVVELINKK